MAVGTYWHLEGKGPPDEYAVATSRLLYYPGRGFEVATPVSAWYARYQAGSPLACSDWERFADPRGTTYAGYVARQAASEERLDGILDGPGRNAHDAGLPGDWLDGLERLLPPLRYPVHAFQMIACYVGQMAPSGRIAVAAMFQGADEMRRVQRLAYRMAQLRALRPGFGAGARDAWEHDPAWQPMREAVERLLATYDWGEAFVGLNLVLKPAADALVTERLAGAAARHGDRILAGMLEPLAEDAAWHRAWSRALVETALADRAENVAVIDRWTAAWTPLVRRAITALEPLFRV